MRSVVAWIALAGCHRGPDVVSLIPVEHNQLATIVAITADGPVHAQGRCVADDDSDDVRILDRQGPDRLLDLPLAGLRDDTTWSCEVEVDDGKRVQTYPIAVEPSGVPLGVGGYAVEGATDPDGYTLITEWDHNRAHPNVRTTIVDPQGRARWYRFTDHEVVAGLDGSLTPSGLVLTGGGPDQAPTWYDALGDIVFALGEPPIPGPYHHHAESVDGGVLTMVNPVNHRLDGTEFTGLALVLFDATGQPTWTWDSQQAVDAGIFVGPGVDPFHANSVSLVDDALGPAAWVSLYTPQQLIRIDRATGVVTHTLGRGGDFELRDPSGAVLPDDAWFSSQHDPEFAWPRVLLYDNGIQGAHSRALELELDLAALTATVTWEWTDPDWYEPLFGDADRIADDRALITRGRCWTECAPLRPNDQRIADIVEVDRQGAVGFRLVAPDSERGMYRAERIDPCLLWHDPKLCD